MTDGWIQTIGGALTLVATGIFGLFHRRIAELGEKHTALELYVEREKASKSDLRDFSDRMDLNFGEIKATLVRVETSIAGKADKH